MENFGEKPSDVKITPVIYKDPALLYCFRRFCS